VLGVDELEGGALRREAEGIDAAEPDVPSKSTRKKRPFQSSPKPVPG
jgi:hypothetical protein